MSSNKELSIRERVGNFYINNEHMKKSLIVNHFRFEGIPKSTIYSIIKRVDNVISLDRKSGSGRSGRIDQKLKDKVIEDNVNEIGRSYRSIGRQRSIHHRTAKKILNEAGVVKKKRKKAPKSNENQKKRQKKCLEKLSRGLLRPSNNVDVIMDDESYFTVDGSNCFGNDSYHSFDGLEAPENVKYRFTSKFPSKVMVWIAMSAKGLSDPLIIKSGQAIDASLYIKECLNKRLVKFIAKHHSDGKYIFWPDLATSHYANLTQAEYARLQIKYVPKNLNPPNVPQVRPIENFWSILERKVYLNGWKAETNEDLIKRIKRVLKEIPPNVCQRLMRGLKTKVRKAADNGVLSVIN
jgi:transposase